MPNLTRRYDSRHNNALPSRYISRASLFRLELGHSIRDHAPEIPTPKVLLTMKLLQHALLAVTAFLLICAAPIAAFAADDVKRPERNIVFFITDDESPTLGCYGDPVAVTPNIDAIAKDGTLFHNAFATTASCSASRSVVLSGLHNHMNGQYGHTRITSISSPRTMMW